MTDSGLSGAMTDAAAAPVSLARVYWTAFIGLFFDYYDLYLFIYLEKVLVANFALSPTASNWLQFAGLAGVGAGALGFGYLADRHGRGRMLLAAFAVYVAGIAGMALAWSPVSLLAFRLLASLALGAEWGISHTYLAERAEAGQRYRFAALLQFSLLGGLLAAFAVRFALPAWGWRLLFAASIPPVVLLSFLRWRALLGAGDLPAAASGLAAPRASVTLAETLRANLGAFALCLGLASLSIASGTVNVFIAKDLPQSAGYTALFWGAVAPGMMLGAVLVRRFGVGRTLIAHASVLLGLSLACWLTAWEGRKLAFALGLAFINGIPFGLMGAFFAEMFSDFRTMFSGAAYNLGRILAGSAPWLVGILGLRSGDNYFLFTALLGLALASLGTVVLRRTGTGRR